MTPARPAAQGDRAGEREQKSHDGGAPGRRRNRRMGEAKRNPSLPCARKTQAGEREKGDRR